MKKLITILLLFVCSFSYAQNKPKEKWWNKSDDIYYSSRDTVKTVLDESPGTYLVKSSNSSLGAIAFYGIGTALMTLSYSKDMKDDSEALRIAGIGFTAVGAIMHIRGIVLIGKAGRKMNSTQKSLSYKISPTGAGLAFNF